MPYLGYFLARTSKSYCHISNQYPRNYLIGEIWGKGKIPKSRTKKPYLGILRLEFENNIVTFEISNLKFI